MDYNFSVHERMVLSYRSLTDWTVLYQKLWNNALFTNKVVDVNLFNHHSWTITDYSAFISNVSTRQFISQLFQKHTCGQGQSQMRFSCLCRLYPRLCSCTRPNVFSSSLKCSSLFDPFLGIRLIVCCRQALLSSWLWSESSHSLLSAAAAHNGTFLATSY